MEVSFTLSPTPGGKRRRISAPNSAPGPLRIPRLSRLMALAIRFDTLIQEGAVTDQATLARLGGVTRARLTQIMHLLRLAPDIQEELMLLPAGSRLVERTLRPVVRLVGRSDQGVLFSRPKKNGPEWRHFRRFDVASIQSACIRKSLKMALEGDRTALKLMVERAVAPLQDNRVCGSRRCGLLRT